MTQKKAFRIEGTFPMGINRNQRFAKELLGQDKDDVTERLYSLLGSEHGVERRRIKIDTVKELKPDEVTNLKIKQQLGAK